MIDLYCPPISFQVSFLCLRQVKDEWVELGPAGQAEYEGQVQQEADAAVSGRTRKLLKLHAKTAQHQGILTDTAQPEQSLALVAGVDGFYRMQSTEEHQLALFAAPVQMDVVHSLGSSKKIVRILTGNSHRTEFND